MMVKAGAKPINESASSEVRGAETHFGRRNIEIFTSLRFRAHLLPKINSGHFSDDGIVELLLPAASASANADSHINGTSVVIRTHYRSSNTALSHKAQ